MSLAKFWNTMRRFRPAGGSRLGESPHLDTDAELGAWAERNGTAWQTPDIMSAYDPTDFDFLPPQEASHLRESVGEFRRLIALLSAGGPDADDLRSEARACLFGILDRMEFHRFGDADAYRLGKRIERQIAAIRPPELAELHYLTDEDSTGDPVLRVRAILSIDDDVRFRQVAKSVREMLAAATYDITEEYWPHIHFQSVSEQSEYREEALAS